MVCKNCGMNAKDDIRFCSSCGELLEEDAEIKKVCPACSFSCDDAAAFCSKCGFDFAEQKIDETVENEEILDSVCSDCGFEFVSINDMFCPKCGKKRGILRTNCPHCNALITNSDDVFCVACGKKLAAESVAEKVKNNGFIKSVSSDFSQSKAIKMVKTSAEGGINKIKKVDSSVKKKLIVAILVVLLVIILPLIIISNIHKCENCGETYFGKPNAVTYWYETFYVCDECA